MNRVGEAAQVNSSSGPLYSVSLRGVGCHFQEVRHLSESDFRVSAQCREELRGDSRCIVPDPFMH